MTMTKDDDNAMLKWIKGINPQALVLCTAMVMTGYAAVGTRITVVEQNVPHLNDQVAANKAAIDRLHQDAVDRVQYNLDRQNIELQLDAIRASQERILTMLAENGTRAGK